MELPTAHLPRLTGPVVRSARSGSLHDQLLDVVSMLDRQPTRRVHDVELVPTYKLLRVYEGLLSVARYRSIIQAAIRSRRGSPSTSCQTLIADRMIQVDILTLLPERPIPLHDHPGSAGVLLVLSGSISIDQYDMIPSRRDCRTKTLVELRRVSCKDLALGGVSLFARDRGNIHSMRAITERSVVLDIVAPPYRRQERSWFFRLSVDPASERGTFARLRARTEIAYA